jgi:putative addiction module CopG family antidote
MRKENNTTLSVSLTEMMRSYVEDRVADGTYTSISDYMRDLIRADMERANKLATLRQMVKEGTDALARHEGIPLTKDLLAGIPGRGGHHTEQSVEKREED